MNFALATVGPATTAAATTISAPHKSFFESTGLTLFGFDLYV
jgi:hypothetical protein